MIRPDLESVPTALIGKGFAIRIFRPDDETAQAAIVRAALNAAPEEAAFSEYPASDDAFLSGRVFLALHGDRPVGWAAALRQMVYGEGTGYVGMLAVMPAYRRRGLGTALLAACLRYFKRRGWREAVLDTDSRRLPAIRLYLRFGFEPFPETREEFARWREILVLLGRPGLAARLKSPPRPPEPRRVRPAHGPE